MPSSSSRSPNSLSASWLLWIRIISVLLGTFQFGIAMALLNTMLDALVEEERLDFDKNITGAILTASLYLGCGIGSYLSGRVQTLFKDFSQLALAVLFFCGSVLCGFTTTDHFCWGGVFNGCVPFMLLIGRIITGIAGGICVVISPKYLAEVAPPKLRMSLCTVFELCFVAGVVFGVAVGLPYEFESFDIGYPWWRVMFLLCAIPAFLQILLELFSVIGHQSITADDDLQLPLTQSVHSMDGISVKSENQDEISPLIMDAEEEIVMLENQEQLTTTGATVPFHVLFEKRYRRSVILGLGVPFVCQLSGTIVIDSYSTTIFEDAGFSRPIIGSILFGITNLIATIITAIVIGRFKRRNIAFFSFIGMGVCFLGVALADLSDESVRGVLSVGFVLVYVMFYSAGCGPLSTAYAPEVVPPSIAGTVLGLGQSLCRFTDLILVLVFPAMLDQLGALPTFLVFSIFAFGSYLFLRVYMIETNGRELKDIFHQLTLE